MYAAMRLKSFHFGKLLLALFAAQDLTDSIVIINVKCDHKLQILFFIFERLCYRVQTASLKETE